MATNKLIIAALREYRKIRRAHTTYHVLSPEEKHALALRKYGLTLETYEWIYQAQQGCCLICRDHHSVLLVDHCHSTHQIRGLLCHSCNTGLGMFRDCPKRLAAAIEYLGEKDRSLEELFRRLPKDQITCKYVIFTKKFCLAYQIPLLPIPARIFVPRDEEDLIYGEFDWKDTDKATLRQAALHIKAKEAVLIKARTAPMIKARRVQLKCDWSQLRAFIRLNQAALKRANGNLDLTFEQLAKVKC